MKATRSTTRLLAVAIGSFALLAAACGSDKDTSTTKVTAAGESTTVQPADTAVTDTTVAETTVADTAAPSLFEGELAGLFAVDPGVCTGGATSGSYFRMVQPGGTADAGPFIPNADSACADTTYSLLSPGTDGGLTTGAWQAAPDPAFDATGNGLADMIVAPVTFFGVAFAAATDPNETAPSVTASDGVLTGDMSAFTAYYGTGVFNQGAPKPDGSGPAPTGTINVTDGSYMLEWTSLIVGGSFDGFTGVWHLEGTFTPTV
jgi:hypothetical protein